MFLVLSECKFLYFFCIVTVKMYRKYHYKNAVCNDLQAIQNSLINFITWKHYNTYFTPYQEEDVDMSGAKLKH